MDLKNIIAAIALSAAVIVLYGLFFAPTQEEIDNLSQNENKKEEIINNTDAPSIEENVPNNVISRDDAIKESSRIFFENELYCSIFYVVDENSLVDWNLADIAGGGTFSFIGNTNTSPDKLDLFTSR